jgi:NAD(P)-dependent dehydrogenase (short-subunit alcohol dehydrogenase family)
MTSFAGKRVVVSGGNSGIGKCIAKCFVDAGAEVVIGSRNPETLSSAAREIGARYAVLDVSDWQSTKSFAESARDMLGGVDVGVNSAGVEQMSLLKRHAPDHVSKMTAIQFNGAVHFMQHVSNVMVDGGNIVNISSLTGMLAAPGYIAYGGAKAGVIHATRVAAVELASRGIRVNVVSPTVVLTALVQKMFEVPGFRAALLEEHPLGMLPAPQDVADAVLWLASDKARCVTGLNMPVDSGAMQTRMPRPADVARHAKMAGN